MQTVLARVWFVWTKPRNCAVGCPSSYILKVHSVLVSFLVSHGFQSQRGLRDHALFFLLQF